MSERALDRIRKISPTLSVGIMTADLMSLGSDLARLEGTGIEVLHIDVMDGCFVPMMTVGPPFISAIRTDLLKDVHLMISDPVGKIEPFVAAGADIITVHAEAGAHIHRTLHQIGGMKNANDPERGIVRGLGINPGTPLAVLEPLLDELEMVVLLAINPGWREPFNPATLERAARVQKMIEESGREILLCVDGGIKKDNIGRLAGTGIDLVVTGSAVYDGVNPADNARLMLDRLRAPAPSG